MSLRCGGGLTKVVPRRFLCPEQGKAILVANFYKRGKGKQAVYWLQYKDHTGRRRTVKGFSDKGLSKQLAGKLESDARLRRTGLVDDDQARVSVSKNAPIGEHLTAFEASLADNTAKHAKLTMSRTRHVVTGCRFGRLADVRQEAVQAFLRGLRAKNEIGHRTYNHYLQAIESFCKWCVATRRLLVSPVRGVERLNTQVDVRHPRRALTQNEFKQLIESAVGSKTRIQGYTGAQRAKIYFLSYMTGLRKSELASLTPASFDLDGSPPTVTVEAACSKHRRKDVLPLHPGLVVRLREWLSGVTAKDKLFPGLAGKKTWLMVQKDLAVAGIPYRTDRGIADFHAAGRHTHITELLRNGATLPEAKELARHSDVNMTMRYTHIGIEDQARAVASLPTPGDQPQPAADTAMADESLLQMCGISGGFESQAVTIAGNESDVHQYKNPCRSKGYVVAGHQVASDDKVEAAGIEPASDFDVSENAISFCENCG
jgi:integrase